jgi:hypothetical protein
MPWNQLILLSNVYRVIFPPELSGPDMKLTVRLLLVPRVRNVELYKGVSIIPETSTVICIEWSYRNAIVDDISSI